MKTVSYLCSSMRWKASSPHDQRLPLPRSPYNALITFAYLYSHENTHVPTGGCGAGGECGAHVPGPAQAAEERPCPVHLQYDLKHRCGDICFVNILLRLLLIFFLRHFWIEWIFACILVLLLFKRGNEYFQ